LPKNSSSIKKFKISSSSLFDKFAEALNSFKLNNIYTKIINTIEDGNITYVTNSNQFNWYQKKYKVLIKIFLIILYINNTINRLKTQIKYN